MTTRSALAATLAVLAAAAAGCATYSGVEPGPRGETEQPSSTPEPRIPGKEPPGARSATSTLLFAGTTFWGRFVEDQARASRLGVKHPFHRLDELDRDRYDAWIAGLECPVVKGLDLDSEQQDRTLSFNCEPDFLPEAARWFSAFTLANNHTGNQGRAGVAETRRHLERHSIQHFGDPDPRRLDQTCAVVTVPARVRRDDGTRHQGKLPLAMCGFDGVFRIPPAEAVAQVARHSAYLPTFALPHNGLEYTATPDSIKVDFARRLIDAGADAVLGDHPHWIQPAEVWHGRLIVHSMGNFMFDQQGDPERTRSAAIRVRLDVPPQKHLADWLALGDACAASRSTCFDDIRAARLPRLRVTMEYAVVGTTNAGGVTRAASPEERAAIRERLRWDAAMADLRRD